MPRLTMQSQVTDMPGVGSARAEKLMKLGISTVKDLIFHFPRAFEKRGDVRPLSQFDVQINCSFILTVATEVKQTTIKRGLTISKFRAFDESGSCEIIFFNCPFVKDVFHIGAEFRFYGKPVLKKSTIQLTNPKYEPYVTGIPLPDYVPIYSQTDGMSSKQIDKLIQIAINDVLPEIIDPIPENIRLSNELSTLTYAIKNAHFPESDESLSKALTRLAFDEMFYFGIGISLSASNKNCSEGIRFSPCSLSPITEILPYELTPSQKSAINDVYKDTVIGNDGRVSPMTRIIVGDVGCGKTICALAAIYIAAKSGYQSALMVPTEILANQHYEDAARLLGQLGLRVGLLLGSTKQKEKKELKKALSVGELDVIIGTHALLSDGVEFSKLGLVITDEQHRFGVLQRARLKEKSESAHMLVMSATPIPRTLALAMYGDLDISRITDMPKGRQRVDTFVVNESYRTRLNDFISKQVALGGQAYIVCPSIEGQDDESDEYVLDFIGEKALNAKSLNLKNAVEYAESLKNALPSLNVDVLHGKMKAAEKDKIMSRFSSGETNVLVSTTVIEVGVNVPNASLMIVENAERFGLSQLHQLRGRVGRGARKSYCVLVSDVNSEKAQERLSVMKSSYDGYEIAEKDLIMRGPGDFFSSISDNNFRQSGGFDFKFASMCDNSELFSKAFSSAKAIIENDPDLALPEHSNLKNEVYLRLKTDSSTIS